MNITLETERVPATLTLTSPSSLQILTVWSLESYSQGTNLLKTPLPLGHINKSKRGLQNTPLSKTVASRCACPRYQGSTPDVIPWELAVGALGAHSCRWWGHQRSLGNGWVFTGERKKKNTCHFSFFSFEVTKLQGWGGNCCSDFILWEAGGCLPDAAAHGSFTLHAASGFRGELFLFSDHLPL